jgi:CheY-like chemotaxis protein
MQERERKRILLVDDDTSLLLTLSEFLKFEGYDVVTADSGEQGLKRLARMTPDLIVLDMSMPGMGGVGFLREISGPDGKPKHPVLVLTARANMAEFFANVDVDGFVAKPCDPADLLMEISRIIFLRSGEESAADTRVLQKKKILLGEDDRAVSLGVVHGLTEAGYVVEALDKGPEVLERAIVSRPDVIVMKVVLQGMNGEAVAGLLREMPNTRAIPIVLYDDSSAPEPETKYMTAGSAVRRVVRGNKPADLVAAVRKTLSEEARG